MNESLSSSNDNTSEQTSYGRLIDVALDAKSMASSNRDVETERKSAIYDLLEDNRFTPKGTEAGNEFCLQLSMLDAKLVLDVRTANGAPVCTHMLSLTPFRRIIKDYFLMCESYFQAIKTATPSRIEAIDMGRRGLHNEGAQILKERLEEKIAMDTATARRLFTLVCALHWKG